MNITLQTQVTRLTDSDVVACYNFCILHSARSHPN